jgi:hypothetical protein
MPNTTIPVTSYIRPKGSATWRIEEIVRGIGTPGLLLDTLSGHFELQQPNLISYSEDLSNAAWENTSPTQLRYFDPALSVDVQDITIVNTPNTVGDNGLSYSFATLNGALSQRVAVASGETYTVSFFVAGVSDYQGASLGVFDADSGLIITPPLLYGPTLLDGFEYTRVALRFTVPLTCNFVRLQLITDTVPFPQFTDDADSATFSSTDPAHFVSSTDYLQIGNTTLSIPTATPVER